MLALYTASFWLVRPAHIDPCEAPIQNVTPAAWQQVYYNDPDEPPGANYNRLVQLPASSSLGPGYHQLLAYEFAGLAANAVFGLLDGVDQFVSNASLIVDRRMVLPPL